MTEMILRSHFLNETKNKGQFTAEESEERCDQAQPTKEFGAFM